MRSRYTAYVRRDEAYLKRTWHSSTRPASLNLDGVQWRGLDVIDFTPGESQSTVTFVAHWVDHQDLPGSMRETSRFVREDGHWTYVDGDVA